MEQVSKHNKVEDCWIVLNGNIFDITEYIPYHPGGDDILKAKGKDGTVLFYHLHRWVNVDALIKNCWIGQVLNYKPPKMDSIGTQRNYNNKNKNKAKKNVQINPNDRNRQETMSRTRKLITQRNEIVSRLANKNKKSNADSKDSKESKKSEVDQITNDFEKTKFIEIEKEDNLDQLE
eukprot:UN02833